MVKRKNNDGSDATRMPKLKEAIAEFSRKLPHLSDRKKVDLTSHDIELQDSVRTHPMRLESFTDTDKRVFVAAVTRKK